MTLRKVALAAWLITAAWPGWTLAQIPGIPGGGASSLFAPSAGAASGLGGVAAPAAAAAQPTLGGFFGLTKSNLAACKMKFCASPFGALSNSALGPYSTFTGGLIPMCCPSVPSDSTIAALAAKGGANGAEAVAAKVKKDEADAKARRAAIRYLATVDCHYWPEAEAAIISGLRDDRNECVRYEAALALLNGCCCNAKTIEALNIVVAVTKKDAEKDGKPAETSERVRCAALAALQGCLLRYEAPDQGPSEQPSTPESPEGVSASLPLDPAFQRVSYYYKTLARRPEAQVVADARKTVARIASKPPRQEPAMPGERSVFHAMARASKPKPPAVRSNPEVPDTTSEDLRPIENVPVVSSPASPTVARVSGSPANGRKGLIALIRGAADPNSGN